MTRDPIFLLKSHWPRFSEQAELLGIPTRASPHCQKEPLPCPLARSPGTQPCPQSTLWDLAHCSWSGPRGNSQPGRRGSPRGGGLESQGLRDCNCCGPAQ